LRAPNSPGTPRHPRLSPANETARQRVGAFAALPALIRQLGADPALLIAGAGLAPDALDAPEGRASYAALGRLMRDAAARTACPHFGLLAGRIWRLADLGLLGELVRHSPTVGEALQTLTVHQHLNSEGGLAFLIQRGGVVDLGYAIYHPGAAGAEQYYDAVMAAAVNFMRDLCGPGWAPSEVFLPRERPVQTAPYRSVFKVAPRFDAEVCAVRFPERWLTQAVAGADPARLRAARASAEVLGHGQLIEQVRRALRLLLLQGGASGNDAARMLSMHRRTLNRRLHAEGTTFQQLLDEIRFEVARQLLAGSRIALDDVAATLGYSGVCPFMRAFRRWSGTTPGRWRREAAEGAQP